jgi:type IV secretory pathway ATPase VirB11/archaellum biosynthesis ATPase
MVFTSTPGGPTSAAIRSMSLAATAGSVVSAGLGGEVTVRDLVRNPVRMRPDRIVGEVRGGEALDMLQAMNTGHDGSLSIAQANFVTRWSDGHGCVVRSLSS